MSGLLILRRVRVQGANAVAGLTWGFPAVSAFLGFCDALGRRLSAEASSPLFGGCAIVCHEHQQLTDAHYGVHQFCLTRNPLTKKGQVAPFNEEGRMHLTVSLMIEVNDSVEALLNAFDEELPEDVDVEDEFARRVLVETLSLRMAGGSILDVEESRYVPNVDLDGTAVDSRKWLFRSLPGFALVDRSHLLSSHHEALRTHDPDTTLLTAWMDFGGLRYRSDESAEEGVFWQQVRLPAIGWFVPLMLGYQGIAPLQPAGAVPGARDPSVPFRLVESIYGVGQWMSPHRARSIGSLMWRPALIGDGQYRLVNRFHQQTSDSEGSS